MRAWHIEVKLVVRASKSRGQIPSSIINNSDRITPKEVIINAQVPCKGNSKNKIRNAWKKKDWQLAFTSGIAVVPECSDKLPYDGALPICSAS